MDTSAAPLASIGIDIGKEVFHLVGFGPDGKIAFRRKIKRRARLTKCALRHASMPMMQGGSFLNVSTSASCASSATSHASFQRSM
jgi:hypothetical protein